MTLDEFARKIGLSTGTVSYALAGKGRVSASTRERVERLAKEYGYAPHRAASQLASGCSHLIAIESSTRWVFESEFAAKVLSAIQRELAEADYSIVLDRPRPHVELGEFLSHAFRSKAIDGAILMDANSVSRDVLMSLGESGQPLAAVCYTDDSIDKLYGLPTNVGVVTVEERPGVRDLVELIGELGHREVAYVNEGRFGSIREIFLDECARVGIDVVACFETEATIEAGSRALREILRLPTLPSAIATRKDILAIGIMQEAKRKGISVPGDLSISGFDDDTISQVVDPALTTIGLDPTRIGTLAAQRLLSLLGRRIPTSREVCGTYLVCRDSLVQPGKSQDQENTKN